ncbi:InlB B-repeat-containing protein [Evtepia sp.]|uniref:InlB B-repeat-containing protein n=1 Tax=Evtepia sp. TaxID=2773933 RepID=UPI002A750B33|nr:InlB B-repeat-containing protein [Evtepia sp.]
MNTLDDLINAVKEINTNGGNAEIILGADIMLNPEKWKKEGGQDDSLTFEKGTVTILGEGHTLDVYNPDIKDQRGMSICGDAVVNLGKDGYEQSLTIKGGGGKETKNVLMQPLFTVRENSTLNMYEHVKVCDSSSNGTTGGIAIGHGTEDKSQFNMYGGVIDNCHNSSSVSGGVMVLSSNSTFTLRGGTISNCSGIKGGGVSVAPGHMLFSGGQIKNCSASSFGGAIFNEGEVEITGGTITGNSATYGGGIMNYPEGTLAIGADAAIHNNTADSAGDDIYNFGDGSGAISFSAPPAGLTLASTSKAISGWYEDGVEDIRWSKTHLDLIEPTQNSTDWFALKAAHGYYTINFNANSGSGEMNESVVPPGEYTLPYCEFVAPNNMRFKGWSHKADGDVIASETISVEEDTVLYAIWEAVPPTTYKVTLDANGGTVNPTVMTTGPDGRLSELPSPTRNRYAFNGWYSAMDGGEKITSETVFSADTTIYAHWTRKDGNGDTPIYTYYTLSFDTNGGTTYPDMRYVSGSTVALDKTPVREGYTFNGWYADESLSVRIHNIRMTSDKTVYAGWVATEYPALFNSKDHIAYIVGYPDGMVGPTDSITREQVATILYRLLRAEIRAEYDNTVATTTTPFPDVEPERWSNRAIYTMVALDVFRGYDSGIFAPDAPITRAEFAAVCARFDQHDITIGNTFRDVSGHWAQNDIERAAALGWVQGYPDGNYYPESNITRAQAVTMINRVLGRLPETEDDLLPGMKTWLDNPSSAWYYLAIQEATNDHDYIRKSDGIHEMWEVLK